MGNKRLRILINDKAIHDNSNGIYALKSWSFTSTYQRAIDTLKFVVTRKDINNIYVNDEVKVYIEDDLVFRGPIDTAEDIISNNSDNITISCRDYMGELADNDATPEVWSSILDTEIYRQLTSGYDFITSVTNVGYSISKYEISMGESIYDAMASVAIKNKKYLRLTPQGELIVAKIADEGLEPSIIIDIENNFSGTARILRSIKDACSEINIEGHIATTASSASSSSDDSMLLYGADLDIETNDYLLYGDVSSSARASGGNSTTYFTTIKNQDANNNIFRTLGSKRTVNPSDRLRSSFQKRRYMSISSRNNNEVEVQASTYLQRNAVEFRISLEFNQLYYLPINTVVRIKSASRQIDHNMYIQEISMSESLRQRKTSMTLRLPGRIK